MASLKQEMREKFETRSSMAFWENNSGFEEGLLEKIMNLTYASLRPYTDKRWDITAVRSPVLLQRLSRAADDRRIPDCALALLICDSEEIPVQPAENKGPGKEAAGNSRLPDRTRTTEQELELFSLSVGYAAKYYCIDCFTGKAFDPAMVAREFPLNRRSPLLIIGLGCFRSSGAAAVLPEPAAHFRAEAIRIL
jgi:hypothetical protein